MQQCIVAMNMKVFITMPLQAAFRDWCNAVLE
jgi:hypothetical protein